MTFFAWGHGHSLIPVLTNFWLLEKRFMPFKGFTYLVPNIFAERHIRPSTIDCTNLVPTFQIVCQIKSPGHMPSILTVENVFRNHKFNLALPSNSSAHNPNSLIVN